MTMSIRDESDIEKLLGNAERSGPEPPHREPDIGYHRLSDLVRGAMSIEAGARILEREWGASDAPPGNPASGATALEYWRLQARRMVQVLGWSSWVVDDIERLARYARRTFGASLDVDRAAEYLSGRIQVLIDSGEYTPEALQKVLSEWVAKGKSIVE